MLIYSLSAFFSVFYVLDRVGETEDVLDEGFGIFLQDDAQEESDTGRKVLLQDPAQKKQEKVGEETPADWMKQPVEETLKGLDYIPVCEKNYEEEVYKADRPVMVLFYNNEGEGSQGLAALARMLHKSFPGIKFCAFELTPKATVRRSRLEEFKKKYPLETSPALVFYRKRKGRVKYLGQLHGGITTTECLESEYKFLAKYVLPNKVLN